MSNTDATRYPDTADERLAWLEQGTPAPFVPYTADAKDSVREGLLAGWRAHFGKRS